MKKFEYKRKVVERYYASARRQEESPMQDTLDDYGEEGWELCAVSAPDCAGTVVAYFKREKQD